MSDVVIICQVRDDQALQLQRIDVRALRLVRDRAIRPDQQRVGHCRVPGRIERRELRIKLS